MANTKMTKKDVVTLMLADDHIKENEVFVGYLENELKLLNKKSSSKKATKTQKENENIKARILQILADNETPMTVTEILKTGQFDDFEVTITNQKVTALLRQLVIAKKVERTVEKKITRFSIAE